MYVQLLIYQILSMKALPGVQARGERIMLKHLPTMLCCTAPKMHLLCSTNVPIMLRLWLIKLSRVRYYRHSTLNLNSQWGGSFVLTFRFRIKTLHRGSKLAK